MKHLYLLLLVFTFFACSKEKEPIQGKLEDYVSGEMSFERDAETGFMGFQGSIIKDGNEMAYTKWNEIFSFYDVKNGRKIATYVVPREGPMAFKGMPEVGGLLADGGLFVTSSTGFTNIYKIDTLTLSYMRDMEEYEPDKYLYLADMRNAFHELADGKYELTFNPFEFMAFREGRDGLDLSFKSWIGEFDGEGKLLCKSDFKAPYDESYSQSSSGGKLVRMVAEGKSWVMFPYSDSLYQIKNCMVISRRKLPKLTPFPYYPDVYVGDRNRGSWERPDDGALNLHLIHDLYSGLNVRMTLVKDKKGNTEIKDPRQRMFLDEKTYLLLIYDSEWKLRAELEIVYPTGTRFENIFSTSEGLLINKPEQKSEDEYEFYKIDLSGFAD
ncbi:hypothetical protein ACPUEN_20520 [Algoriphagus yeomjeoni]|uniref:hypothetical protein n=1 Tax=Algoriphagus yeomjeoni TaxID=291403 RepID=UPI003CE59E9C